MEDPWAEHTRKCTNLFVFIARESTPTTKGKLRATATKVKPEILEHFEKGYLNPAQERALLALWETYQEEVVKPGADTKILHDRFSSAVLDIVLTPRHHETTPKAPVAAA